MGTYALAKEIETFFIQKVEKYNEQRRIDSESIMQIHSFIGAERNLSEHTDAFWSAFTPAQAGKGSAVEFVRKKLKMNTEQIIVCVLNRIGVVIVILKPFLLFAFLFARTSFKIVWYAP